MDKRFKLSLRLNLAISSKGTDSPSRRYGVKVAILKLVSMNSPDLPYRIFPLGDSAVTVDFGNYINEAINRQVIARFNQLQEQPIPGTTEVVPAYSSFTVYYDMMAVQKIIPGGHSTLDYIKTRLEEKLLQPVREDDSNKRLIRIPACYEEEFAPDIHYLAAEKKITVEEVIDIYQSKEYKVYMLGFLPGFTYMGELDERVAMPRKPQPQNVEAGSVGIAGRQTGIYPLSSPGGWQIIGRTPLQLFDPHKEAPTLLKPGDRVRFYSIGKKDFYEIQNTSSGREEGGSAI